jgi:hypothetical protein
MAALPADGHIADLQRSALASVSEDTSTGYHRQRWLDAHEAGQEVLQ